MKRTIDLTEVMQHLENNLIPVLESITTDEFNDEIKALFLDKTKSLLEEASTEELERFVALAVGEQIINPISNLAKKEDK
ncbi:hypothetical protein [Latilactobacillus curvatus]|uniref:hypothetical protein n=1 Tax=Latilactobacillus curvatus TaxID=28038 RepID=UPI000FECC831|nr:hypothetical protein [Latilactobacillus curvatus]QAR35248.1 hypothetical protein EQK21_03950 [Latilactobacillus curvatus]